MDQAHQPKAQPETADFVQRGKILIVRRQFLEAVKVCRLGLLAEPTYVEGRLVLGLALMALGRHDEVLAEMSAALEIDPDSPMAHLLKGEALYHKREYDKAEEVLLAARALDPRNDKVGRLLDAVEERLDELSGVHPVDEGQRTITKVYPVKGTEGVESLSEQRAELSTSIVSEHIRSATGLDDGLDDGDGPPALDARAVFDDDDDETSLSDVPREVFDEQPLVEPLPSAAADYPAADYPADDYPAADYPAADYPAADYPAADYPAADYPAADYPAADYPAADYPAADYPADHPDDDLADDRADARGGPERELGRPRPMDDLRASSGEDDFEFSTALWLPPRHRPPVDSWAEGSFTDEGGVEEDTDVGELGSEQQTDADEALDGEQEECPTAVNAGRPPPEALFGDADESVERPLASRASRDRQPAGAFERPAEEAGSSDRWQGDAPERWAGETDAKDTEDEEDSWGGPTEADPSLPGAAGNGRWSIKSGALPVEASSDAAEQSAQAPQWAPRQPGDATAALDIEGAIPSVLPAPLAPVPSVGEANRGLPAFPGDVRTPSPVGAPSLDDVDRSVEGDADHRFADAPMLDDPMAAPIYDAPVDDEAVDEAVDGPMDDAPVERAYEAGRAPAVVPFQSGELTVDAPQVTASSPADDDAQAFLISARAEARQDDLSGAASGLSRPDGENRAEDSAPDVAAAKPTGSLPEISVMMLPESMPPLPPDADLSREDIPLSPDPAEAGASAPMTRVKLGARPSREAIADWPDEPPTGDPGVERGWDDGAAGPPSRLDSDEMPAEVAGGFTPADDPYGPVAGHHVPALDDPYSDDPHRDPHREPHDDAYGDGANADAFGGPDPHDEHGGADPYVGGPAGAYDDPMGAEPYGGAGDDPYGEPAHGAARAAPYGGDPYDQPAADPYGGGAGPYGPAHDEPYGDGAEDPYGGAAAAPYGNGVPEDPYGAPAGPAPAGPAPAGPAPYAEEAFDAGADPYREDPYHPVHDEPAAYDDGYGDQGQAVDPGGGHHVGADHHGPGGYEPALDDLGLGASEDHGDRPPGGGLAQRFNQQHQRPHTEYLDQDRGQEISHGDGLLEQMTGAPHAARDMAASPVVDRRRGALPRRPSTGRPPTRSTTFLTLLLGEPGSRRWVFLLAGSIGVLALAVGVGLLVRYLRVSDEIEGKRQAALTRLRQGNLDDFDNARQVYATIVGRRADDLEAQAMLARINGAIPVEFGTLIPASERVVPQGGTSETVEENRRAAEVYNALIKGDLVAASQQIFKARNALPRSALLLYLDGRVHLLTGKPVLAEKSLKRAHEFDAKDVNTLRMLAEAQVARGKHEQAAQTLGRALALNADHVGSLISQARLRLLKRIELAQVDATLRSVVGGNRLASRGQRGWAYLLLARLATIRGRVKSANDLVRLAKGSEPVADPTFFDDLAGVLIDCFKLGEAERQALRSEQIMPGRPHPKYRKAQIYLHHGRPRDALRALRQSARLPQSSLLKARIHLQVGEVALARKEAETALRRAPGQLDATVVKAEVLAAEGAAAEAESLLRPLIAKHPRNAKLTTAMGKIHLARKQPALARGKFQEALRLDRHAVSARLLLADAYLAEGNHKAAHRELVTASRNNAWHVAARQQLAALDFDQWDLGEAGTALGEVLKKAPENQAARLALVRVLTARREYGLAEEQLRKLGKTKVPLNLARGRLALARGKAQQATLQLRAASRRTPKNTEAWSLLIQAHLYENVSVSVHTARSVAREMAEKLPGDPESHAALGRVEWSAGKLSSAIRHLGRAVRALKLSPRPPRVEAEIRVLLGRAYSDNGRLDSALSQFDQAHVTCKKCPWPLHRKALALDEKGRGQDAIVLLKQAMQADRKNPDVHLDLAKVYENNNMASLAIAMYRRYLTFNPPADLAKAARQAIQSLR